MAGPTSAAEDLARRPLSVLSVVVKQEFTAWVWSSAVEQDDEPPPLED